MVKMIEKRNYLADRYNPMVDSQESKICEEDSSEAGCCGYQLRIDFDDFGWDWILQPRHYFTRYCAGVCRSVTSFSYSRNVVRLLRTESSPCCTPVKRYPLSVIYYDNTGRLNVRVVQDLVVGSCGCN